MGYVDVESLTFSEWKLYTVTQTVEIFSILVKTLVEKLNENHKLFK